MTSLTELRTMIASKLNPSPLDPLPIGSTRHADRAKVRQAATVERKAKRRAMREAARR